MKARKQKCDGKQVWPYKVKVGFKNIAQVTNYTLNYKNRHEHV